MKQKITKAWAVIKNGNIILEDFYSKGNSNLLAIFKSKYCSGQSFKKCYLCDKETIKKVEIKIIN